MSDGSIAELCLVEKLASTAQPLPYLLETYGRVVQAMASNAELAGCLAELRPIVVNYVALYLQHGKVFGGKPIMTQGSVI